MVGVGMIVGGTVLVGGGAALIGSSLSGCAAAGTAASTAASSAATTVGAAVVAGGPLAWIGAAVVGAGATTKMARYAAGGGLPTKCVGAAIVGATTKVARDAAGGGLPTKWATPAMMESFVDAGVAHCDCWKACVRDMSAEPSRGMPLMNLLNHPNIKGFAVDAESLYLTNAWGEQFVINLVFLPGGLVALHAEQLEGKAANSDFTMGWTDLFAAMSRANEDVSHLLDKKLQDQDADLGEILRELLESVALEKNSRDNCTAVLKGNITITRVAGKALEDREWRACEKRMLRPEMEGMHQGFETHASGLQAGFAIMFIGGGVLSGGSVQEEIKYAICPEQCISMLVCPCMLPGEAIQTSGTEQFSKYSGYAFSLQFGGDHQDISERAEDATVKSSNVAMDALDGNLISLSEQQFVDCDKLDAGCNGGLMDNGFSNLEKNVACTEASCRISSDSPGTLGQPWTLGAVSLEKGIAIQVC